ncbi:hypothetical protein NJC40_00405 [Pseudomonas sp. 21LCFQ02]|uniref:hypothetical protein n=1 Tax=Pseudomonas sp. 21LCFQ02 TaxID=2957505 RepID=UPI00209ABB2C|nr:hypothetical protein [Pseudomonas sp. 21LCFQ02]MCO8166241.1 hypothetical protein [Pseudomonas sp. 21LCFQ02]
MFSLIRRLVSKSDVPKLPQISAEVAFRAGEMISISLMSERSAPGIIAKLNFPFSRGYLFGWIDAASQCANIPLTDKEFVVYMSAGHYPLKDDIGDSTSFVLSSAKLQGTPSFDNGRSLGAQEYMASLDGKLNMPIGLITFIRR